MAENFYAKSNDGKSVPAKYLTYYGATCYDAGGKPYIVAADFSLEDFVERYRMSGGLIIAEFRDSLNPDSFWYDETGMNAMINYQMAVCGILARNFPASGPDDLQRTYNGNTFRDGDGFVKDFTPAASFVFGVASAILEVPQMECEAGGGFVNLRERFTPNFLFDDHLEQAIQYVQLAATGGHPYIDISGFLGNNPNNILNIEQGYRFVQQYRLDQYYSYQTRD